LTASLLYKLPNFSKDSLYYFGEYHSRLGLEKETWFKKRFKTGLA
jgi:hypothetical protein